SGGYAPFPVRALFPAACDAGDVGLSAEVAIGANFAGDASDFTSEGVKLVDHGVDGVFEFENFAFDVDGDFAREVATSDGGCDFGDVAYLTSEVAGHRVHRVSEVLPSSSDARHDSLTAEIAVGSHVARDG